MPELPEVETVRRGLANLIIGKTVLREVHDTPNGFPNAPQDVATFLIGALITGVRRRAKVLMIDLSTSYTLVIHLKMTGQLVFRGEQVFGAGHPSDSLIGRLPDKSTRVTIEFNDGSRLFFNDQRKFGWMRLLPTAEVQNIDFMKKVGPEPLIGQPEQEFIRRIRHRNGTVIKAAILDQLVIAGIGNIYADEALWGAQVHPATRVRDLSDEKLGEILQAAIDVMTISIEKGGSTDRNYVDAEGKRGSYLEFAKVFRREGQTCPRCNTIIEKTRVAGRGTHVCLNCQRLRD